MRRIVGPTYDHGRLEIGPGQVSRWTDVYATSDPVSEGDLPVADLGSSEQIVNRRLLLLDHTAYWENVERFRSNVALEIARVGGWNDLTELPPAVCAATGAPRRARSGSSSPPAGRSSSPPCAARSPLAAALALVALAAAEALWGLWSNLRTKAEYPPPPLVSLVAK